jgi:DNA-binding GntR family transcriptional regulator
MPEFTPPRFQTAEEYAYSVLREMILSGRLQGGEKLNQDEIAQELKLSRMPVRQAIRRLESDGLVINRPNRGAVVTQLGPSAILELFEMRSVLEGLAVALAIKRMESAGLRELQRRTDELEASEHDISLWISRHDEFHRFIWGFADRPNLAAQLSHLRQRVAPLLRIYLASHEQAEMPGVEHRTLLRSIAGGDPDEAERTMREHVMTAAQGVVDFVTDFDQSRDKISDGKASPE